MEDSSHLTVSSVADLVNSEAISEKQETGATPVAVPDVHLTIPNHDKSLVTNHQPVLDYPHNDLQRPEEFVRSISVLSKASTVAEPKAPNPREYKLKIFIAILFCLIVAGVSVIYHFYNRHIYELTLGRRIYFDEIERTLRVNDEHGNEVLRGELGLTLPEGMLPYNCEPDKLYKETSCIGWMNKARVYIDYNESSHINCYHINWINEGDYTYPYDCYELGDAKWYGGILPAWGDFQNLEFDRKPFLTSTVNSPGGFGPVIEPFWLTSKSVAIYIEGNPPLHVELNKRNAKNETDGKFCLVSLYVESAYENWAGNSPWLNYTVCTGPNMLDIHKYMLERLANNNPQPPAPSIEKFEQMVYSTWPQFKEDITQDGILEYVQSLVDDQMAKGLVVLQEGWQSAHGDLTFDTNKFPNSTAMINDIHSKGFTLGVGVTHMVGTDSQAFQHRLNDDSLVKDAGGVTGGLVDYYIGPHTQEWHQTHSAAIDFSSPSYYNHSTNQQSNQATNPANNQPPNQAHNQPLISYSGIKRDTGVDEVIYEGGQVDLLPYRAHFIAQYDTPNSYTRDYVTQVQDAWTFVQTAYKTQRLDQFVQLYDANSLVDRESNGYKSVLPNALALGIMGYPLFVPNAIEGTHYPPPLSDTSKNLYKRWAQLATFFPIMQFSSLPNQYDQETVDLVNDYAQKHITEVVPEVMTVLNDANSKLYPIVRPLWWYDPTDQKCVDITDQFMVGKKILVAPVLDPDATSRDVYLPAGRWLDKNGGLEHTGPVTLEAYSAGADVIPHFVLQTD